MTSPRKRENSLIVIEGGSLQVYPLDEKLTWSIGRSGKGRVPDIRLHALTISRDHGELSSSSGEWLYLDHRSLNGTIHNGKQMLPERGNRIRPVMLEDGDILVFGSGKSAVICSQTAFAVFSKYTYGDGNWRVADTKGAVHLKFSGNGSCLEFDRPKKGQLFRAEDGMAIYMGDITYLFGTVSVKAS